MPIVLCKTSVRLKDARNTPYDVDNKIRVWPMTSIPSLKRIVVVADTEDIHLIKDYYNACDLTDVSNLWPCTSSALSEDEILQSLRPRHDRPHI